MNSTSLLKYSAASIVAAGWFLLAACNTRESWTIMPSLSPPVATVVGKPMDHAEEMAKRIPNSYVMIAHSGVRFAIYPNGTVLIIQKIEWHHLRAGMTAVYYIDQGVTAAMKGGILTHRDGNIWHVHEVETWRPPGIGGQGRVDSINQTRYEGVVVAAFLEKDNYDPQVMLRYPPADIPGSCALRCHTPAPR